MFCAYCGKEIPDDAQFCGYCGSPIASAATEIKQDKPVNFIQAQPAVVPTAAVYVNQNANQSALAADEKFCFSCGSVIKKAAEICPKCGVNQSKQSGTTAVDVYCTSCGKSIKKEAAVCPFCGVSQGGNATKNKSTAMLLCLFTVCGHRFYTGKIWTAILMGLLWLVMSICGAAATEAEEAGIAAGIFAIGFLVWWIIDLVMIGNGSFRDKQGNPLKKT